MLEAPDFGNQGQANILRLGPRAFPLEPATSLVYVAAFMLGMFLCIVAVAELEPVAGGAGIAVAAFAVLMLHEDAYSIWGTLEIERSETGWVVRKRLGKRVRTLEIRAAAVAGAEVYQPGPGGRGPQVHVYLRYRRFPVSVGDGLGLDHEVLTALRDMFIAAM